METITLKNYTKFAKKTFKRADSVRENFIHMALGLASEYFEFKKAMNIFNINDFQLYLEGENFKINEAAVIEELGDLMWYSAILCDLLWIDDFESVVKNGINRFSSFDGLEDSIEKILSEAKRIHAYGKDADPSYLADLAYEFVVSLIPLVLSFNFDYSTFKDKMPHIDFIEKVILQSNIEKLKLRYPAGFNNLDAMKRADKNGI